MKVEVIPNRRHISLEEGWANINALRAQNIDVEQSKDYKFETRVVQMMEIILDKKANTMTVDEMLKKYDAILM